MKISVQLDIEVAVVLAAIAKEVQDSWPAESAAGRPAAYLAILKRGEKQLREGVATWASGPTLTLPDTGIISPTHLERSAPATAGDKLISPGTLASAPARSKRGKSGRTRPSSAPLLPPSGS